ncbi:DMT family transporter [Nakamurella flavida]|uniref:DMT family transporter n=1 Tax=Nakamurella flavida TaxID=363630 RepID=A0A938YM64_9ACTN|nr:DMT family transporter [Nakamurella flavida]MBM9475789.1 DMT family transporter [Nakamurella flavida]MDP9777930.1 drug/metabolite transporter (DMT)-like permease [Nakamurella flavida]
MTTSVPTRGSVGVLLVGVLSAVAFAASGPFVKPLLLSGWSSAAAVMVRVGIGGLLLTPLALIALRGRFAALGRSWRRITLYGLIAVAGTQFCYFAAVQRLPVGVALLTEYLAPVLLVGLAWARGRRPSLVVAAGAVLSVLGLLLVLDLTGGVRLDLIGVLWGLGAAVGLCGYFLISAAPADGLPPVALAAGGLLVGSLALALTGVVGLLPLEVSWAPVALFGGTVPWWVPMGVVAVIATAVAYVTGIVAAAGLGSRVASFLGLLEVLASVAIAWLLLGEVPTWLQAAGAVLVLTGVALVRADRAGREQIVEIVPPVTARS